MSNLKLLSRCKNTIASSLSPNKINPILAARSYSEKSRYLPANPVTHTGQQWDDDDYRMVRFVDKKKWVNPNFAVDLIAEVPPIACTDRVVWCDGGSGPEGHPKVYINLDKPGNHTCGYCGLRFYLDHCKH